MNTVSNLEDLKKQAQGDIVTLPGWGNEPFVCRVKRVSILGLASKGLIPNPLLTSANKLFNYSMDEKTKLDEAGKVISLIAKETLVEPSYDQLTEAGLELTDQQQLLLFNFSQQGLKALELFRNE